MSSEDDAVSADRPYACLLRLCTGEAQQAKRKRVAAFFLCVVFPRCLIDTDQLCSQILSTVLITSAHNSSERLKPVPSIVIFAHNSSGDEMSAIYVPVERRYLRNAFRDADVRTYTQATCWLSCPVLLRLVVHFVDIRFNQNILARF
ncbi:uncharacterized protein LOC142814503 isoform X2 [Rhipicephalus microplus]|uniref:uncharacterized protein LOC142814503 isoform X2 n=1 Tax=Rhipicephalus microplus TaxID=6941 RepID=UPI003F6D4747